ncbi:MAG: hypothetical protein LBV08_01325 [Clostridiales bacterium]|jgi:hypothetical protein|nr:hypothetical protein [Clostridiales bacterium]
MAQEKISFEQFIEAADKNNQPFVQDLHNYMLDRGCKAVFEEKKSGYLASYKYGKPPKAVMNFLFRKAGMLARIYGEHIGNYPDFLNTMPSTMVSSVQDAGICKRIVLDKCSPHCRGYDFTINGDHYQKCRYRCFEFLITNESAPYIREFIEHELTERATV